jgi:hypothetical protein
MYKTANLTLNIHSVNIAVLKCFHTGESGAIAGGFDSRFMGPINLQKNF